MMQHTKRSARDTQHNILHSAGNLIHKRFQSAEQHESQSYWINIKSHLKEDSNYFLELKFYFASHCFQSVCEGN